MELDAPHTLSAFFQHLLQLKRDGLDNLPGYVEAGAMHILNLKQVHRELCEATEGLREATAEAKSQLDQSSLQLQNLLYEQQHYEKEIASCRAYKSAFPDEMLELIPEEEFRQMWQVQRNSLASDDPHTLMLNRLSHELTSREETVKELEGVKAQRDALAADVAAKRSTLGALEAEVAKLLGQAQRVQQQFGIAPAGLPTGSRLAAMLPQPLYVLYTQLHTAIAVAPADAPVQASLAVNSSGDAAAVERLVAMHRIPSAPNAAALPQQLQAAPAAANEAFPLTLTLALKKQRSPNPQLSVTFRFFPAAGLVTAAGARAEQDTVLASLYPGDDGSTLPEGPSSSSGGLEVQQLAGKPYRWAQHAAGLDLLPPLPPQLYSGAPAAGGSLADAAAALQQYSSERRAAAILDRLKEAVMQPKK